MLKIYLTGIILGFVAAIIPGPINIEVIRRSLRNGPRLGFTFGIGAITADTLYVASMSFGLLALLAALPLWGKGTLSVLGGCLLAYLGLLGLLADVPPPPELPEEGDAPAEVPKRGWYEYFHSYTTGFFLTASSPSAFGFWIAVSLPLTQQMPALKQSAGPLILAAGVATAIAIWITFAVTLANGVYRRVKPTVIQRVEQVLGVVMLAFAALAFVEGVRMLAGHDSNLEPANLPKAIFGPKKQKTTGTLETNEGLPATTAPAHMDTPDLTTGVLTIDAVTTIATSLSTTMTTAQNQPRPWFPYGTD